MFHSLPHFLTPTQTSPPERTAPDSLRPGASQAAGAAPTLRYGPAGDSAPRLRLRRLVWPKGSFRPVHRARTTPLFLREQRLSPDRPAAGQGAKRRKRTLDGEDRSGIIQGRGERGFLPTGATAIS